MVDVTTSLEDLYISFLVQFGFLVLFAPYFPLSGLIILITNSILLLMIKFEISKIMKRVLSINIKSIGVWNLILNSLGYLGPFYSAYIIIFPAKGLGGVLGEEDPERDKVIVLIALTCLTVVKFLIQLITPSAPAWVLRARRVRRMVSRLNL